MASIASIVGISSKRISVNPASAVVGSGNITAANPAVVTVASHGLATGDYVSFSGILQANWTALNGNSYEITKLTANTFSIAVNASAFGAYTDAAGKVWNDFNSLKYFPLKLRLAAIDFFGSAAADVLIVRDGSSSGAIVFHKKDVTPAGIERPEHLAAVRTRPFINWSECTIGGTSTDATVVIELA